MVPRFFSLGQDHSVKGPFSKGFQQLKPMPSHFWLQLQAFIYEISFAKNLRPYNLALFLRGISIKMPANVIIKKAPIVFPTSIQLQLLYYCLSQLFYLSLLSLQTVIYVPFFVFQKIAFTSSIVDPDQNACISVTSIVKFLDRRHPTYS